jgi:hypothetical protein
MIFHRRKFLLRFAAVLLPVGLVSCSPPVVVPSTKTSTPTAYPTHTPAPRSFGETAMQITPLSGREGARIRIAPLILDADGTASLLWMESGTDFMDAKLMFRRRTSSGDWTAREEWNVQDLHSLAPMFLAGTDNRPCIAYFEDWNSRILKIQCRSESGREKTPYQGYVERYPSEQVLFLDEPAVAAADTRWNDKGNRVLFFGADPLTSEGMNVSGMDAIKDADGTYRLAVAASLPSDGVYRLFVLSSSDRGRTWTAPELLSQNKAWAPKFYLSSSGVLYLSWFAEKKIILASYNAANADGVPESYPLPSNFSTFYDDLFLGEDSDGDLHIALWIFKRCSVCMDRCRKVSLPRS